MSGEQPIIQPDCTSSQIGLATCRLHTPQDQSSYNTVPMNLCVNFGLLSHQHSTHTPNWWPNAQQSTTTPQMIWNADNCLIGTGLFTFDPLILH